jgi:hypothetical protein
MACNGIRNDMSWNRQWSLTGLGFAGFLKNTHSDLDDNGAMVIKTTFLVNVDYRLYF